MHAGALNRLAAERARYAIMAGAGDATGVGARNTQALIVGGATSDGWAGDYLAGSLQRRAISGDTIIDPYGTALIYVCPVIRGVKGYWVAAGVTGSRPTFPIDERHYGLETRGRTITDSVSSDIRATAGIRFATDFELWSAGPDRRAEATRDAGTNRDNLAVRHYLVDLR